MSRAPAAGEETWADRNRYEPRDWRDEDRPKPPVCWVCQTGDVELDWSDRCAECQPLEEESCADYAERMKGRAK